MGGGLFLYGNESVLLHNGIIRYSIAKAELVIRITSQKREEHCIKNSLL